MPRGETGAVAPKVVKDPSMSEESWGLVEVEELPGEGGKGKNPLGTKPEVLIGGETGGGP